jgi:hypothetical protein
LRGTRFGSANALTCRFVPPLQCEGRGFEPLSAHKRTRRSKGYVLIVITYATVGALVASRFDSPLSRTSLRTPQPAAEDEM